MTKNIHMCYIGVTDGKIDLSLASLFLLTNTLSLPEGVHKI